MITPATPFATVESDRTCRERRRGPAYSRGVPNSMWRQALRRRRHPVTDT